MSTTWNSEVGDRGRLVIPSEFRAKRNWPTGTALIAVESELGLTFIERDTLHQLVARQLSESDLVAELLSERRSDSHREDAA